MSTTMIRSRLEPSERAASMNSRSRIPSTWPLTTRAIGHHENRMITTTVIISPGPARATSEMAKSRNGNDRTTSMTRDRIVSATLP